MKEREKQYDTIDSLLADMDCYDGIHIECTKEEEQAVFDSFRKLEDAGDAAYLLRTDQGYARSTVEGYLKFFERILGSRRSSKEVLREFQLEKIRRKRLKACSVSEGMRVNFARLALAESPLCFLENPLTEIDAASQQVILRWIGDQSQRGTKFVSTTSSLRHGLLLPGTVFFREEDRYVPVLPQEEGQETEAPDFCKLAARSEGGLLLFDPKDVDYIESVGKANFLSVREGAYQIERTMDELEGRLRKYGFFRCHRSYIVNMQKVDEMERWTKNSYCLKLNDRARSRIPLAKGRVAAMKELFDL